jgi:hypothetical protein
MSIFSDMGTLVGSKLAEKVSLSGGTLTGSLTLSGDPSSSLEAATKQYADTQVSNLETGTVASNTSNISTNTSNISTLQSDVSTNQSNISTNSSNISSNASSISSLQTQTGSLASDGNSADFSGNLSAGSVIVNSVSLGDYSSFETELLLAM